MLRQAAKFIFRAFHSKFLFGSGLGQTEKSQNSPSGKVLKTQKNPAEIERFQPDLVGVSLKDLAKHSKINGLQAAS